MKELIHKGKKDALPIQESMFELLRLVVWGDLLHQHIKTIRKY